MEPAATSQAVPAGAATDLEARVAFLADRLSDGLRPLAAVAYNYVWSWLPDGTAVFRDVDPVAWERSGCNPVRFLGDLRPWTQEAVERDPALQERIMALAGDVTAYLARDLRPRPGVDGPVAFLCAEFGVHASLPLYSGGLGVLAGDILKEASDQGLPLVAVGLFYRRGYLRQRIDIGGGQHEYWPVCDPDTMPLSRVVSPDGPPLVIGVPLFGQETVAQVWRVEVGRVPLLLLDTERPENDAVQRWTTARLYERSVAVRLAQYGLLGIGGARLLRAVGVEPSVVHLNEGHPALAPLELAAHQVEAGSTFHDALADVRRRTVFTTHTPVAAGNETYAREELVAAYAGLPERLGIDQETLVGLCRTDPGDAAERPGMTPLALRVSDRRNGVSRLHGEVARRMWQPLFRNARASDVPIGHVTNGAHVPTWLSDPMRRLLTRHLGDGWLRNGADPGAWSGVRAIPNAELWAARCEAREQLVGWAHEKGEQDLLLRGAQVADVRSLARRIEPDALTLGFARRLATYKRLGLLAHDIARLRRILDGPPPVQLVIAGKAHPADEVGKATLMRLFELLEADDHLLDRVVFLEDYDTEIARRLVSGCDVWVNLPRKPMEASGTSGMKSAFNGGLQLSVLDGWWAEAYNGANGWAIPGDEAADSAIADASDAAVFYDILERDVVPLFHDRGADGVPHGWCELVKESLVTCGPAYSATRILEEYVERLYRAA